jgi:hypothetical protein
MRAGQDAAAHTQDHRPVPMHQRRERILGLPPCPVHVDLEQPGIAQPAKCAQLVERANLPEGVMG